MKKLSFFLMALLLTIGVNTAWAETLTLNNLGAGLSSTSNTTLATTTIKATGSSTDSYTLNYLQGKKQNNAILIAKGSSGGTSFISNQTPIPGNIKSITVYINSGASGSTTYHCAFSTTECTEKYTTGSTAVNIKGGNSNKYTCALENASYFCVSLGNNNNGQVLKLDVEYEPQTGADVIVKTLKSIAIEGMTTTYEQGDLFKFDGTCTATYSVTKNDEAQEDETKTVIPTVSAPDMDKIGEQTITVTYTEGEATVTTTYVITVTENVITAGTYDITLNNELFGTAASANITTAVTAKQNDITLTIDGTGQTKPRTDAEYLRFYAQSSLKLSAPEGYVISKIVVTPHTSDYSNPTANVGTFENDSKTWTGFEKSVVLSFAAKSFVKTVSVTYIADVKAVLTFTAPENGTLEVLNGETPVETGAMIQEGTKLTITAAPNAGYAVGAIAVTNGEEDVTETVYADGVLTMPAYDVTISVTFEQKPCTLLDAPKATATTTYNSATLTWETVENAVKYIVTFDEKATEVTDTTYTINDLKANYAYSYSVQSIAAEDQALYCDSEAAEARFTTEQAPLATLVLSMNGTESNLEGEHRLNDVVELPAKIDNDCLKQFVGWSADAQCATAPEYAPGAEYALTEATQTLYAVYAAGEAGGTEVIKHNSATTTNMTGNNDANTYFDLDDAKWSIVAAKGSANNNIGLNKDGTTRLYYHASGSNTLTITAPSKVESMQLEFNGTYNNAWVKVDGNTVNPADGVYTINANSFVIGNANTSNTQVHIKTITVTLAGSYTDFSTTCSVALDVPTFSVEAGEYTEAQSIVIAATEGTIYYTLDGTTPTAESTVYTEAIVLDKCGATTIKAIAISGEAQSEVVSATYTIKLPLDNSQENPYTEQEAIDVYNGDCYNNQDVYVIGVVKTAKLYTSGSYTITLEGGFQFYMFYEAAGETKFTEDYITAGDTLVACGKLGKHNTTYQLAAGCYLVDRKAYSVPKVDISNTEATAYTVEEAWTLIDDINSDLSKEVYVKGIVSEIVEAFSEQYGNITYNISTDGTTESNQLKVYRGKSFNGDKFTSADDIKVGDKVVVYGKLTKYNNTSYQVDSGSALVDRQREGGDGTALDNIETNVAPVKVIENGQMIIIKNGVKYNAQGAVVK